MMNAVVAADNMLQPDLLTAEICQGYSFLVRTADYSRVYDRYRLTDRGMVVGELEVTTLPCIERRAVVIELLLTVHPGLEEAVSPG